MSTDSKNKSIQLAFRKTINSVLNKLSIRHNKDEKIPSELVVGLSGIESCSSSFDYFHDRLGPNPALGQEIRSSPRKQRIANLKSKLKDSPRLLYKSTSKYFKHPKSEKEPPLVIGSDRKSIFNVDNIDYEQNSILKCLLFEHFNNQLSTNFITHNSQSLIECDNTDPELQDSSFSSVIVHNDEGIDEKDKSQEQTFLVHDDQDDNECQSSDDLNSRQVFLLENVLNHSHASIF